MLMSMMVGRRWIDRTGVCDADGYSGKVGDDGMVIMLRMMVVMIWVVVILGMIMLVFVLMIPPTTAQPILQI